MSCVVCLNAGRVPRRGFVGEISLLLSSKECPRSVAGRIEVVNCRFPLSWPSTAQVGVGRYPLLGEFVLGGSGPSKDRPRKVVSRSEVSIEAGVVTLASFWDILCFCFDSFFSKASECLRYSSELRAGGCSPPTEGRSVDTCVSCLDSSKSLSSSLVSSSDDCNESARKVLFVTSGVRRCRGRSAFGISIGGGKASKQSSSLSKLFPRCTEGLIALARSSISSSRSSLLSSEASLSEYSITRSLMSSSNSSTTTSSSSSPPSSTAIVSSSSLSVSIALFSATPLVDDFSKLGIALSDSLPKVQLLISFFFGLVGPVPP
mmetsp:Transcript_71650/g.191186  ORF Transcript_71650/g.191186 Transcript_71650/m.191186 type:complete len:318 (+) Transcript_71650:469-1422(+)